MTIIEYNIETSRQGDDELLILPVGVTSALLAAGHVVYPVGALYLERDVPELLHERQVPPRVEEFREVYYPCFFQFHIWFSVFFANSTFLNATAITTV